MGRKDAVQFTLECAAEWRRLGARVTFEPGWETRGNGTSANYEGCLVHHTAFLSSAANPNPARKTLIGGRPDLTGPLCNVTIPWCADGDPWIHVIAANPSNHAGASGGRSMGPLPVTSLFNPRVYGAEIDYAGLTPMTNGQYLASGIFARGTTNVLGRSTEYARAHAETSITGKWDPGYANGKTLDMAVFRRDAAALQGDDMPLSQDDLNKISVVVKEWSAKSLASTPLIDWGGGKTATLPQQVADTMKAVAAIQGQMAGLLEALSGIGGGGVDLAAVKDAAEAGAQEALSRVQLTVAADDDA